LDRRKWRERKGRDLKGGRIPCLDSKIGGKGFGGEGIERKMWINFVRVVILPKVERFGRKTQSLFLSLPFPPRQTRTSFLPFLFPSFPFPPFPFPPFLFHPNLLSKHSLKECK
jgi:hypothetical protein